ncbi:MAG: FHA domain-containing protein [Gammaproteobacteria bacterium]|jgi:pSer/pThr/pTyr-binding forkhead associated (FHA) protein|nr:MAG: FHA domain-containing protein [Gammaproteobacteria bacterium]
MAVLNLLVDDVVVKSFPLEKSGITIGRSPDCDIQIEESSVSSKHSRIEMIPNPIVAALTDIFIEDLGSMNGTWVNDEQTSRQIIQNKDRIRIAFTEFVLVTDVSGNLAKTTVML